MMPISHARSSAVLGRAQGKGLFESRTPEGLRTNNKAFYVAFGLDVEFTAVGQYEGPRGFALMAGTSDLRYRLGR